MAMSKNVAYAFVTTLPCYLAAFSPDPLDHRALVAAAARAAARRRRSSGALGTTLLKHILTNRENVRVAVLVNDVGAVNLDERDIKDSRLVKANETARRNDERGCICCTRRDDLLQEVRELAMLKDETDDTKRRFDVLVVESTGVSDPASVGAGVRAATELALRCARLDTMVTVIDAASFSENFASVAVMDHDHAGHGHATAEETRARVRDDVGERVVDLLVSQVEFADVVLLNKADLAGDDRVAFAEKTVQRLNPHATTLATTRAGAVGRLCSDGMWYVSAPPEFWRQAEAAGITDDIMKDFPEEEQMEDPEELNLADSVGDRRQEIVFIGIDLDKEKLEAALDGSTRIPMDDKDPAAVAELRAKFCEDAAKLLGPDPLSKDDPVKPWE
ncbi:cobalamin synthase [Aureococcus anophagefferens]|uniref:Cobalamin synthase n=1 Tax=Aureococcus anophagefferens TaxID=44056 RepID=A0ABR1FIV5_AURAN